jgi:hypothetical protein
MKTYRINQIVEAKKLGKGYVTAFTPETVTVFFFDNQKETTLLLAFNSPEITNEPDHTPVAPAPKKTWEEMVAEAPKAPEWKVNRVRPTRMKLADIVCGIENSQNIRYNAKTKTHENI